MLRTPLVSLFTLKFIFRAVKETPGPGKFRLPSYQACQWESGEIRKVRPFPRVPNTPIKCHRDLNNIFGSSPVCFPIFVTIELGGN